MGALVLDSSVVLAVLAPEDVHHAAARSALEAAASEPLCVSVVTYAEIMVGAIRKGDEAVSTAEGFFDEVIARIEPVSRAIARKAAELRAAHAGLGLPDAIVIATGDELDADRTLTADARWRHVSPRIQILPEPD